MLVERCYSINMFLPNVFKVIPVKSVLVVVSDYKHRIALTQLPTEKQKKGLLCVELKILNCKRSSDCTCISETEKGLLFHHM